MINSELILIPEQCSMSIAHTICHAQCVCPKTFWPPVLFSKIKRFFRLLLTNVYFSMSALHRLICHYRQVWGPLVSFSPDRNAWNKCKQVQMLQVITRIKFDHNMLVMSWHKCCFTDLRPAVRGQTKPTTLWERAANLNLDYYNEEWP